MLIINSISVWQSNKTVPRKDLVKKGGYIPESCMCQQAWKSTFNCFENYHMLQYITDKPGFIKVFKKRSMVIQSLFYVNLFIHLTLSLNILKLLTCWKAYNHNCQLKNNALPLCWAPKEPHRIPLSLLRMLNWFRSPSLCKTT